MHGVLGQLPQNMELGAITDEEEEDDDDTKGGRSLVGQSAGRRAGGR